MNWLFELLVLVGGALVVYIGARLVDEINGRIDRVNEQVREVQHAPAKYHPSAK